MGCTLFWVKLGRPNAFAYLWFAFTSQMALLFNINIQRAYILVARQSCATEFVAGKENIFLHMKVSAYKVYSMISLSRTHLFLTVNTSS